MRFLEVPAVRNSAIASKFTPLPWFNAGPNSDPLSGPSGSPDPHIAAAFTAGLLSRMSVPVCHMGWVDPWFGDMAQGVTQTDLANGIRDGIFPYDRAVGHCVQIGAAIRSVGKAKSIVWDYFDAEQRPNWQNVTDPHSPYHALFPILQPTDRLVFDQQCSRATYYTCREVNRSMGINPDAATVFACSRNGQGWGDSPVNTLGIKGVVRSHLLFTTGKPAELARMYDEIIRNTPCLITLDNSLPPTTIIQQLAIVDRATRDTGAVDVLLFPGDPSVPVNPDPHVQWAQQTAQAIARLDALNAAIGATAATPV